MSSYEIFNWDKKWFQNPSQDPSENKLYCNLLCKPELTEEEIKDLKNKEYLIFQDGFSQVFTIIYSDKENATVEEIESILNVNRIKN